MGRLSNISGKEAVKIFEKFGYVLDHYSVLKIKTGFVCIAAISIVKYFEEVHRWVAA
ncbi:hypothetical protein [Nostoc sp.]